MGQNYQQRRWVFTWQEVEDCPLPSIRSVRTLLSNKSYFADDWVFQLEEGDKTKRKHYQGRFSLYKQRKSKTVLLKTIAKFGLDPKGLTLDWEKGTVAESVAYCTKEESRLDGPWYSSSIIDYEGEDVKLKTLYLWQQKIVSYLQSAPIDLLLDQLR